MTAKQKCGSVVIVGRPNVGKSTLFNRLIGRHLSPVTYKPQTSRYNIKGILTQDDCQIVFVDTPGIHRARVTPLNRVLNRNAKSALEGVDLILMMAIANQWSKQDEEIYELIKHYDTPRVLLINKVDLVDDKTELLPLMATLSEKHLFEAMIPISALRPNVFDLIRDEIIKHLPVRAFMFEKDKLSDRPVRFIIAELVRENIMKMCHAELPYVIHSQVRSLNESDQLLKAEVDIWVDKPSHQTILIGKGGVNLKHIGIVARKQIQRILNKNVYLKLRVKMKRTNAHKQALINEYLH